MHLYQCHLMSCRCSLPRGDIREETQRKPLPKNAKTGSNQLWTSLGNSKPMASVWIAKWPLAVYSPKPNGLRGISKPRNAAEIIHLKRRKYAVDQFVKITAKFNFWREIQILKGCKIKIFETSKILILPPNFFAA